VTSRSVFLFVSIGLALGISVSSVEAQDVTEASQEVAQEVLPPILEHMPLACMNTDGFPEFTAEVPGDLQTVRVFFRSNISTTFYFVEMTKVEGLWEAVIPKPEFPPTESVIYYIEAVDKSGNNMRTGEYSPRIDNSCAEARRVEDAPNITVGATEAGVLSVPAGFSAEGIVGFVNLAAGSEQIAVGVGLGTKAILGLVGAGAAGTTLVTIAATGDESPSSPQSNPQ
jgi:hypothetical protein